MATAVMRVLGQEDVPLTVLDYDDDIATMVDVPGFGTLVIGKDREKVALFQHGSTTPHWKAHAWYEDTVMIPMLHKDDRLDVLVTL